MLSTVQCVEVLGFSRNAMHVLPLRFQDKLMTEPNEAFNALRVFLETFGLVEHIQMFYFIIPHVY